MGYIREAADIVNRYDLAGVFQEFPNLQVQSAGGNMRAWNAVARNLVDQYAIDFGDSALLFAMLEVRPVPFCVLDEVDAALDEANIGRFTDALRSLAEGTQFIVITHNRGTIEVADALYGVTVGDDSVSRVISLRLDEATALARQDGDGSATNGQAPTAVASA